MAFFLSFCSLIPTMRLPTGRLRDYTVTWSECQGKIVMRILIIEYKTQKVYNYPDHSMVIELMISQRHTVDKRINLRGS